MSDPEKLTLPATGETQPTLGSATPSDMSFMEEKEHGDVAPDSKSIRSHEAENENEADLARVESSLYPSSWKLFSLLTGVGLAVFLVALDMTIVSTAIPKITDQFHSLQDVGWYGSGFFLTFASFQSTWVRLLHHEINFNHI